MPSVNCSRIRANLAAEFARQAAFSVYPSVNLRLHGCDLLPALSVYPYEPFEQFDDVLQRSDPPLLVVEILPLHAGTADIYQTLQWCLAHHVRSAWLVAPLLASVTIYLPGNRVQSYPATGIHADFTAVLS